MREKDVAFLTGTVAASGRIRTMKVTSAARGAHQPGLIAPCGMNCRLCIAYVRKRNPCPGCRVEDPGKPKTRTGCRVRNCAARRGRFCTDCASFPCELLKHLDKRYRANYGMSMIDNLRRIAGEGLRGFVAQEKIRWACPGCGATICVHRQSCLACGRNWR